MAEDFNRKRDKAGRFLSKHAKADLELKASGKQIVYVKITGLDELMGALNKLAQTSGQNVSAEVGYTQQYAIYVHENLTAKHPRGGQAKFLEEPARSMSAELGRVAIEVYKATSNFKTAIKTICLMLQRASMKLVPVDTGALRASAYTKVE